MKITKNLEFGWNHIFEPTPKNVELALRSIRRIVVGVGTLTFVAGYEWVIFWLSISQLVLEEGASYIGQATIAGAKEQIILEGPKEATDQLTMTTKVIEDKDADTIIKGETLKD